MFNYFRKSITVIALMLVVLLCLTACNPVLPEFSYPTAPAKGEVTSNGGMAVGYGDYIYYVNGYVNNVASDNVYVGHVKSGDIVRIKKSDLEAIIAINEEDLSSSDITKKIAEKVYSKVELVVPNFYYTASTATATSGLYIFGDKLYFTTPNSEQLTAGGVKRTSELNLCKCDLDGKNMQVMYNFTNNKLDLVLCEVGGKVSVMYVSGGQLHHVDLEAKKDTVVAETVSAQQFVQNQGMVFFLNEDGEICQYTAGDQDVVALTKDKEDTVTYTIQQVNAPYVYFTKTDSTNSQADNIQLFCVKKGADAKVVFNYSDFTKLSYLGYNETIVWTGTPFESSTTLYGLFIAEDDTASSYKTVIDPLTNQHEITLVSIDGSILTYDMLNTRYVVDLSASSYQPVAIAKSVTSTTWGWAKADIVDNFTFTFASSTNGANVSAIMYDAVEDENSATTVVKSVYVEEDAE